MADNAEDDQGVLLPPDETPDAADPASIAKVRRKRKQKDDEAGKFWRMCLRLEIGRKVLWDILNEAGVFRATFASTPVGFPSSDKTWFHLGEKSLGERIYHTLVKHDPEAAMLMLKEHHPSFVVPKPPRMRTENATDR